MNKNPILPPPSKTLNVPVRPIHVKIVQLYLEGKSYKTICKMVGTNRATIANTIKRHGITEMLESQLEQCCHEIAALTTKAVDVLRRSLDSEDGYVALRAADMVFKLSRLYDTAPRKEETATTQMQKVLELLKGKSVETVGEN